LTVAYDGAVTPSSPNTWIASSLLVGSTTRASTSNANTRSATARSNPNTAKAVSNACHNLAVPRTSHRGTTPHSKIKRPLAAMDDLIRDYPQHDQLAIIVSRPDGMPRQSYVVIL
jgi:hypothetical protein